MLSKKYGSLAIWIISLTVMGYSIGLLTRSSVDTWYVTLNRSPLTPPNYWFGIMWSILYIMIAISGWLIWNAKVKGLRLIKGLYITQLLLNWSWTPLFFVLHATSLALGCLALILVIVGALILQVYPKLKTAGYLLIPYWIWSLFAFHLNYYIWRYN